MNNMTYHHLSVLVHRRAEKYGDKVALKYRDYETSQWIPITWNQFSQTVRQVANALVELGVQEEENIGIFSQNKPECLYVDFGAFGENLIIEGFDLRNLPVDSEIRIGDTVRLKVTQIGKECHSGCAIFKKMGECIMPKQGVFTKVLHGGVIHPGDELVIL